MPAVSAASDRRRARALLRSALWGRRGTLGLALAAALAYTAVMLAVPLVAGNILDDVVVGGSTDGVTRGVVILLLLGVARALAGAGRKYQATKNPALVGIDVRDRLFQHVQRLSWSFHDRVGAGQLMARASTDITMIEQAISPIPWFTQSVLLFVLGVIVLTTIEPVLAVATGVTVALAMRFALLRARGLYPAAATVQARLGDYAQFVEQQVQGIRVVKGHGFEPQFRAAGGTFAGGVHDAGIERARIRARFHAALLATPGLAMLVVIGLGGWLGAVGRITPGELFSFLQYLALLVAPVAASAELLAQWPQGMAAAERIAEVLDAEPDVAEPAHPRPLRPGPGTVEFRAVSFGYRPGRPILHDVSLTIPGGQSVALVGTSGSGKTTLVNLLCRFYDPWQGSVLIDGSDVAGVGLRDLRHEVATVFEDTVIFTASIRENLAIGRLDAHDADLERAAQLAEADAFIRELPDAYDTVVGPQGYSLSGGQRQRLAIARAVLRNARILVLDDAMSAVDPPTEAAIRRGLVTAMHGRTTLIIAHRVETISLADRVVLLDGGRIVADGAHTELLSHPAYRRALALDEIGHRTGTGGE